MIDQKIRRVPDAATEVLHFGADYRRSDARSLGTFPGLDLNFCFCSIPDFIQMMWVPGTSYHDVLIKLGYYITEYINLLPLGFLGT